MIVDMVEANSDTPMARYTSSGKIWTATRSCVDILVISLCGRNDLLVSALVCDHHKYRNHALFTVQFSRISLCIFALPASSRGMPHDSNNTGQISSPIAIIAKHSQACLPIKLLKFINSCFIGPRTSHKITLGRPKAPAIIIPCHTDTDCGDCQDNNGSHYRHDQMSPKLIRHSCDSECGTPRVDRKSQSMSNIPSQFAFSNVTEHFLTIATAKEILSRHSSKPNTPSATIRPGTIDIGKITPLLAKPDSLGRRSTPSMTSSESSEQDSAIPCDAITASSSEVPVVSQNSMIKEGSSLPRQNNASKESHTSQRGKIYKLSYTKSEHPPFARPSQSAFVNRLRTAHAMHP